jgi:hypothetical protein
MKLKDHHFILEQSGFTMELESFQNEGIILDLYFTTGWKSLTLELYDELNERFTDHYRVVCSILDPFIVEQLEANVRLCFTK